MEIKKLETKNDKYVLNPMGGRLPLMDIELVDEQQQVWKGKVADFPDNEIPKDMTVFFSRRYDEKNDLDRCLQEVQMPDSIIGKPFLLVPKEKMLCMIMPQMTDGGIMIPTPRTLRRKPRIQ